jgi:hypothetical protein
MQENRSLIEIVREYALARNTYETFSEEEYLQELNELSQEMFKKEDGIKYVYDQHQKEIELVENQINKMQRYLKVLLRGQESIKQYVISQFSNIGMLPAQSVFQPIKVSQSAGKVIIEDVSLIPYKYIRVKKIEEPDKKAILEALKNGEDVPGCRLVKSNYVRGIK